VLAGTVFHGDPDADTPQSAASVVTVADGSPAVADEVNRRIAAWLWDSRERFRIDTRTPAEAVAEALTLPDRPVVIGDGTDNPGCGATGDSTYLLQALIDSGANACFAALHDPAAVAAATAAGVGSTVDLTIGGQHGWASGPPIQCTATVRSITDGVVVHQAMRRGKTLRFGPGVRLRLATVDVVVTSRRSQVFDPEILLLHGIMPQRYDIVAVKSVIHFQAGFAGIGGHMLVADAPGPLSRRIDTLPRTGPTAARWPMNPLAAPGDPARDEQGRQPQWNWSTGSATGVAP
jgi:microcystin degradation protein MlrC